MLVIFMLCSVALIARAVNLQIMDTEFLQGEGEARYLREVQIASTRGVITDRNGEPLAVSTPVDSVWVNPGKLLEYPESIKPLAELLDADAEEIERKLTQRSGRQFVWLSRRINPAKADQIRALKIPGVNLQKEYRRFYPAGEVTAHVIGFTNIDDIGQEGLELAYDSWGPVLDDLAGLSHEIELTNFADGLMADVLIDEIIYFNTLFRFPAPVSVELISCGEANAFYDPETVLITICSEFDAYLRRQYDNL